MPGGQQFDGQRHPYQPAGANNGPFGQNPVRPVNQPTQMPQGKGPGLGGQQPTPAMLDQMKQMYQMQQGQPQMPAGYPPPGMPPMLGGGVTSQPQVFPAQPQMPVGYPPMQPQVMPPSIPTIGQGQQMPQAKGPCNGSSFSIRTTRI